MKELTFPAELLDSRPHSFEEERCRCNRLLCITRGNVIEIKCGKCKRILRIYTSGIVAQKISSE